MTVFPFLSGFSIRISRIVNVCKSWTMLTYSNLASKHTSEHSLVVLKHFRSFTEYHGGTRRFYIFEDFETFCVAILWKRYASKLRCIILLHFELITFRFAYMRTLKPLLSMISGHLDVSLSPKPISFIFWDTRIPKQNPRTPNTCFILVCKTTNVEHRFFWNVGKGGADNSRRSVVVFFENLVNGINIFQKSTAWEFGTSLKFWNQ